MNYRPSLPFCFAQ